MIASYNEAQPCKLQSSCCTVVVVPRSMFIQAPRVHAYFDILEDTLTRGFEGP